jgi:hypothetical protein
MRGSGFFPCDVLLDLMQCDGVFLGLNLPPCNLLLDLLANRGFLFSKVDCKLLV